MNGYKITLLVWYAFSVLIAIGQVGVTRKPLTREAAVITVVILALLAFLVVQA